uniref:ATPase family associated with various cellular activities (AAA), putative n=1 Tax=Theileria annulata TaxID=5874 RepID=A0A3B0NE92_THEAN
MSSLKLDLVFLFSNPVIANPVESLHFKVLETLLKHILLNKPVSEFEISFFRLRFLSTSQLNEAFETLEKVCELVGLSLSDISLKFEDEDLLKVPESPSVTIKSPRLISESVTNVNIEPKSEFELEMCSMFLNTLKYKQLFDSYGVDGYSNILIHGTNSGNIFIDWFKSVQEKVNFDSEGNECLRTLQLSVIRFSEILMPYFGESEQKLRFLFDFAIENARDGVLCICLEGLHNFTNSKDSSGDLDRRILSTLLLLLDGVSKKTPVSDVSIIVVASTEDDPAKLDEALLRPGRLDRIFQLVNHN